MSGNEIKASIAANDKIIEEEAKTGLFTLSKKAQKAIWDNQKLRALCQHEYNEEGFCIYCKREEEQ